MLFVVRAERLELSHLTALEPKSSASTNSATLALSWVVSVIWDIITYRLTKHLIIGAKRYHVKCFCRFCYCKQFAPTIAAKKRHYAAICQWL